MKNTEIAILVTGILLGACGRHSAAPYTPPPEPPIALQPFDESARVYSDNAMAFSDSARLVLRTETEWQAVWKRATLTQPSPPPLPNVDFGRDMVVLVAAGRMKPGDAIRVDSVGVRGSVTVLVVRTVVSCQPFPSDAFPFEIVRIPRSDGPVRFNEHRERSTSCG